jgi:hypothetical protein
MLSTAGTYDPKIPDLLYPWSYEKGSGVIPFEAARLFTKFGPSRAKNYAGVTDPFAVPFPWTPYTRAYPPKSNPKFYIRCFPADHANANMNWANGFVTANTTRFRPYVCQLAAAGEIKLFQIAAYDVNGNVKAVPFHVSLWYQQVSYTSMPMIPQAGTKTVTKAATSTTVAGNHTLTITHLPKGHGLTPGEQIYVDTAGKAPAADGTQLVATAGTTSVTATLPVAPTVSRTVRATISDPYAAPLQYPYDAGQHYPFFWQAWEQILPDGRTPTTPQYLPASQSRLIYGVGTYYEKAGYWPGSSSDADRVTGMFADESGFSFDFRTSATGLASGVDVRQTAAQNQAGTNAPLRVRAFVMIYCDADPDQPTFFLGRAFRKEFSG